MKIINRRNFYEKKNRVILTKTSGNKSEDSNLSPVCSLTNESSSESNLPYEEEYGDLPGTDG